jgi:hypothetical protein
MNGNDVNNTGLGGHGNTLLDRAVEAARRQAVPPEDAAAIRGRVWQRLQDEQALEEAGARGGREVTALVKPAGATAASASMSTSGPIRGCDDVRGLRKAYQTGGLSDARELLVQTHLRECAGCRAVFADAGRGLARLAPWRAAPPAARLDAAAAARSSWRGYFGAAALAGALLAAVVWLFGDAFRGTPSGWRATLEESDGPVYLLAASAAGGVRPLAPGGQLAERDWLRTPRDGSRVEVKPHTELGVSMKRRGKDITVHLERGSIIVRAPARGDGHLMVDTGDATAVVSGTVFSVNRGTKGTRVSVIEGSAEVHHRGQQRILGPGGQLSTSRFVNGLAIRDEIAWSGEAERHAAALSQASSALSSGTGAGAGAGASAGASSGPAALSLSDRLEREGVHWPELRYGSALLPRLPRETALYVAIPNYKDILRRAPALIEQQVRDNATLSRWSHDRDQDAGLGARPARLQELTGPIKLFADVHEYLGDEIVVGLVPTADKREVRPLVIAEVKRPGLRAFLQGEIAKLPGAGDILLLDEAALQADPPAGAPVAPAPAAAIDGHGPAGPGKRPELVVLATDTQLALAADRADLLTLRSGAAAGGFAQTPFGARVADRYRDGAGLLIAADLEAIAGQMVRPGGDAVALLRELGATNMKSLIIEQENLGKVTQNRASIEFGGPRTGVASWLDAPAPMASLDFIGSEASFASAFIVKQPALVLDDLLRLGEVVNPHLRQDMARLEAETGVGLRQDLAATLGNDVAIALDGPLLPVPSWKMVLEVYDPDRLVASLERLVAAYNRLPRHPGPAQLSFTRKPSNSSLRAAASIVSDTYTLRAAGAPFETHLAFVDGYLVMAPNEQLLWKAARTRQTGRNLRTSWRFRDLLPPDREANFSAVVYHNLGDAAAAVGELVVGAGRAADARLQESDALDRLVRQAKPGLLYVYGGPRDIQVASAGGLFGVTLDQVIGSAGVFDVLGRGGARDAVQSPNQAQDQAQPPHQVRDKLPRVLGQP